MRRMRWIAIPICLLLVWNVGTFSDLAPPASAQSGFETNINGIVTNKSTGRPISNASVSIPDFNLGINTDFNGRFYLDNVQIPGPELQTDISVSAEGYGDWKIINILLITGDTLILDVELELSPVTIEIPEGIPLERSAEKIQSLAALDFPTIDQRNAPLPATIRVRVTNQPGTCNHDLPYTVEVVDFRDYVKHVLPFEWV